jgi:CPA2 family monovalent cation:H+ antiporter-2
MVILVVLTMAHLPNFITDLALILAVAGVTTLFFKRIHQPVVLGYIIAGFLVGPHVSLVPTVVDSEGVRVWSEIGVIFLLFSLGLEFSFKKLAKVGGTASITALVEIAIMFGLGLLTGTLLDWTFTDSIFLGAILSISSTTIIVRAFDETGVRTKKFATIVFGVLIVQDLVAVLLMVLLSTFAASQQFSGYDLGIQILKLVFFLTLWFLAGIFFIPTFLKKAKSLLNDETLLVVSIALCLLMVLLAVKAGFSAALGAFIMGSILAETSKGERIEGLMKPVKNLFASVFFVSVGMMIDPSVLIVYVKPILIITSIVLIGMPMATIFGALLSGQSIKHSVQSGMSLSQIGEFSFIIASLGVSLNVTNDFLYPIAVSVSAITTFTTPFLIKKSTPVYKFLENKLPKKWLNSLNRYSISSQQLSAYSEWKELLRGYFFNTVIHTVLIGFLIFLSQRYIHPGISESFSNPITLNIVATGITLMLMTPSIWALAIRRIKKDAYSNLWLNRKINRGPLIAIEIGRLVIAVLLVALLINLYFSLSVAFVIGIISMAAATMVFNQKLQAFYERIEKRFLSNLNEKELKHEVKQEIAPWDAHLTTFDVQPEFQLAGKQLQELKLREKYGVNIALIERGNISLISPNRYERLFPGDKLSVIGTDDQLTRMKDLFDKQSKMIDEQEVHEDQIVLKNFTVSRDSRLLQHSIRSSGIRDEAQALVVGLERDGQRTLNPESNIGLQEGDIVWVVGVKRRIDDFFKINPK